MSITETMALTLLITGSLSLYLILHAAIDLYHNGLPDRTDGLRPDGRPSNRVQPRPI